MLKVTRDTKNIPKVIMGRVSQYKNKYRKIEYNMYSKTSKNKQIIILKVLELKYLAKFS